MNKSYKSVWNEATGTYVAASEVTKSRGKPASSRRIAIALAMASGITMEMAGAPTALAAAVPTYSNLVIDASPGDAAANASVSGAGSIAIGGKANANGQTGADSSAISIGANSIASGAAAMSIGEQAKATGDHAMALGNSSNANAAQAVAVGGFSAVTGIGGVSMGYKASAAANAVALGYLASATATNSVALGAGSTTQANLTAAGYNPGSTTLSGTASVANGEVSVGSAGKERRVTNVAAGAALTDAVNVSQLQSEDAKIDAAGADTASALGGHAAYSASTGAISAPTYNVAGGTQHDVGAALSSLDSATVQFNGAGDAADVKGKKIVNVAAGTQDTDAVNYAQLQAAGLKIDTGGNATNSFVAYDDTTKGTATLGGASGTKLSKVAAGALSDSSSDAVNGSQLYKTNQDVAANSDAITKNTEAITKNSDAIAQNTDAITKNADAINNVADSMSDITKQINSGELGLVQQDQTSRDLMVASDKDGAHVNFAGTAGARELIGVAAGTTSNSAVNVGQLSPVVASLGGGAQVNADGSVTGPTYHVQGGTQTTVGGALDKLDDGLSTLQTQVRDGTIGMVTQNQTSRDILVGAATDGLRVNMAGTAGNRVVTGVATGAIGAQSSDAVNGSQLHATAASTASALGGGSTVNEDGTVSTPTYSVGGTTVNNVGAAITNIDDRVTQNTSDIDSLQRSVGTMTGSVANAVSYDSAAHNQVTLGGSASAPKVKLTNLQDGELSETSSDAVTGSQLWNTNQQVANLNQAVQNQQSTGSSSIAMDTGGPAASATGSNSIAVGGGAQASGDNSVALGAGSVADQANTVSVGSPGNERRITNVADGQGPTDAVNMRQFQQGIGSVARNAYSGVAAATALTMIPDVDPGKTIAVGVGTGNYKGYQAVSLGMSARITQNLKIKAGAGISSADTTYGVGAAYQW